MLEMTMTEGERGANLAPMEASVFKVLQSAYS